MKHKKFLALSLVPAFVLGGALFPQSRPLQSVATGEEARPAHVFPSAGFQVCYPGSEGAGVLMDPCSVEDVVQRVIHFTEDTGFTGGSNALSAAVRSKLIPLLNTLDDGKGGPIIFVEYEGANFTVLARGFSYVYCDLYIAGNYVGPFRVNEARNLADAVQSLVNCVISSGIYTGSIYELRTCLHAKLSEFEEGEGDGRLGYINVGIRIDGENIEVNVCPPDSPGD